MTRIVVFLGPSLQVEQAARILPAVYNPPAAQGDIVRAVREGGAATIALVDGIFASAPAVRHKEILWALARGVAVHGAASMGALRAAELHAYGMQGSGLIYRWYRATPLADDDEVAVAMTPGELGAEPLSEALVNMRVTLRLAERRGLICRTRRRCLTETARAIHFTERTYATLFSRARAGLPDKAAEWLDRLEGFVAKNAIDQKRIDAVGLLTALADRPAVEWRRPAFRMTEAWAADLDAVGLYSPDL